MKPEHGFLLSIGIVCTIGSTILISTMLPPTSQLKTITYIAAAAIIITMITAGRTKTKKTN